MGRFIEKQFSLNINGLDKIESWIKELDDHIRDIEGLLQKIFYTRIEIELLLNQQRKDSETDPNETTD